MMRDVESLDRRPQIINYTQFIELRSIYINHLTLL